MMNRREIIKSEIAAGKQKCPNCADYFYPRNWSRHVKACAARRRKARTSGDAVVLK